MQIIETSFKTFLSLNSKSNLEDAIRTYNPDLHDVRLNGHFENSFLKKFTHIFKGIKRLSLHNWAPIEYDFLYQLKNLEELSLQTFMTPIDFNIISENLCQLNKLSISWNEANIKNFNSLSNVIELYISNSKDKDLTFLTGMPRLKKVRMDQPKIKNLNGIDKLQCLEMALFGGAKSLSDVSAIKHCENLKFLEFDTCPKVNDLSPLSKLTILKVLELISCKNISSIGFVNYLNSLEQISILGTTKVGDDDWKPINMVKRAFINKSGITSTTQKIGPRLSYFSFKGDA
ncbi:MAG: hypothetical protein ACPGLV_14535 [Bacteroidia bacterium]